MGVIIVGGERKWGGKGGDINESDNRLGETDCCSWFINDSDGMLLDISVTFTTRCWTTYVNNRTNMEINSTGNTAGKPNKAKLIVFNLFVNNGFVGLLEVIPPSAIKVRKKCRSPMTKSLEINVEPN